MTTNIGAWTLACVLTTPGVAAAAEKLEEVIVYGVTPTEGIGVDRAKIAAHVQSAGGDEIAKSQSLDLTDYMNRALGSVSINVPDAPEPFKASTARLTVPA